MDVIAGRRGGANEGSKMSSRVVSRKTLEAIL